MEQKPRIRIGVDANKIVVSGDTYYVKDILKAHKFMFNRIWKAWEKHYYNNEDPMDEALKLVEDLNGKAKIKLSISDMYIYKDILEESD